MTNVKALTPLESQILKYLMDNSGTYRTSEDIYRHVWQSEPFECHPVISVHIRHIREKIERNPSKPVLIRMSRGKGYCFNN